MSGPEYDLNDVKAAALRAVGNMDTQKVMGIMFDRLYTLRNQLLHGGAIWNSERCQPQPGYPASSHHSWRVDTA